MLPLGEQLLQQLALEGAQLSAIAAAGRPAGVGGEQGPRAVPALLRTSSSMCAPTKIAGKSATRGIRAARLPSLPVASIPTSAMSRDGTDQRKAKGLSAWLLNAT